jgi:hypothetical protein
VLDCRQNTWSPDIYDLFVRSLFLSVLFKDATLAVLKNGMEGEGGNLKYSEKKA